MDGTARVPLPRPVLTALSLKPGDLLAVTKHPLSLGLESYGEFLTDNWDAVSTVNRWRYVEEFLRRPLTAVEGDGAIEISPGLMLLCPDETVVLEIVGQGLCHFLYLRREPS